MTKKYPPVEIMIGGETTITREMNADERVMWDFCQGEQWTPEQVAHMAANPNKGAIGRIEGFTIYKDARIATPEEGLNTDERRTGKSTNQGTGNLPFRHTS